MGINITDYFNDQKKKNQDAIKVVNDKRNMLRKQLLEIENEKKKWENDKKVENDLLVMMEAREGDTQKLKDRIKDIDEKINGCEEKITVIQKQIDGHIDVEKISFTKVDELLKTLDYFKCLEANEVSGIEDAISLLPVSGFKLDDIGRPVECSIGVEKSLMKTIKIKTSDQHYWKDFRPDVLSWIPKTTTVSNNPDKVNITLIYNHHHQQIILAFIDRSQNKFILSSGILEYDVEDGKIFDSNAYGGYRNRLKKEKKDFTDVVLSLDAIISEMLDSEKGVLDLNKKYNKNPLMTYLKSIILPKTTSTPLFQTSNEKLKSSDIYKVIKQHWDAFVNAPWCSSVSGSIALLKYLLENGEKPRFWCLGFKNCYGFRLRTRDHDWLTGKLYIDIENDSKISNQDIKVIEKYYEQIVAQYGSLLILVKREKD